MKKIEQFIKNYFDMDKCIYSNEYDEVYGFWYFVLRIIVWSFFFAFIIEVIILTILIIIGG